MLLGRGGVVYNCRDIIDGDVLRFMKRLVVAHLYSVRLMMFVGVASYVRLLLILV